MLRQLVSVYRDHEQVPLIRGLDERRAGKYAGLVYFLGAVVFAATFIVFAQVDALKVQQTSIVPSPLAGQNCQALSAVNKQVAISQLLAAVSHPPTFSFTVPGTTPAVSYDSAFFKTHADCLAAVSTTCSWTFTGTAQYSSYVYISCDFAPSVTLKGLSSQDIYPMQWTGTDQNAVSSAALTAVVNTLYPPSSVCAPFLNNPPYQCTQLANVNGFSVLNQALAITSASIAILVAVSKTLIYYYHRTEASEVSTTKAASFEPLGDEEIQSAKDVELVQQIL